MCNGISQDIVASIPKNFAGDFQGGFVSGLFGGRAKERRRGRAEKRLSKRVFLESPFLLCSLKVFRTFQVFWEQTLRGQRRNGLSKNTLLDNRFSARPLRNSFGAPWFFPTNSRNIHPAASARKIQCHQNKNHNTKIVLPKTGPVGQFDSSRGSPSGGHNPPRGSPRKFASQRGS